MPAVVKLSLNVLILDFHCI